MRLDFAMAIILTQGQSPVTGYLRCNILLKTVPQDVVFPFNIYVCLNLDLITTSVNLKAGIVFLVRREGSYVSILVQLGVAIVKRGAEFALVLCHVRSRWIMFSTRPINQFYF